MSRPFALFVPSLMSHQGAEESPEMKEIKVDERTAIYRIRVLKKELNVRTRTNCCA